jgi:hypothetical protein
MVRHRRGETKGPHILHFRINMRMNSFDVSLYPQAGSDHNPARPPVTQNFLFRPHISASIE